MPSKQPPAEIESSATQPSQQPSQAPIPPATPPALLRFKVAALLFGAWLVFLVYLAFLTWSGK